MMWEQGQPTSIRSSLWPPDGPFCLPRDILLCIWLGVTEQRASNEPG
jgi:hypothetical protein